MNVIKRILQYPIKRTLLITALVFCVYVFLSFLSLYVSRVFNAYSPTGIYPDGGTILLSFVRTIVNDFYFVSRLVLELLGITLIAQSIYRIARK